MCPARRSSAGKSSRVRRYNFNSTQLNENQTEDTQYGVLALQRSTNGFDGQLSYFTRYNNLHFMPDPIGDLLLNGIASDISRQSYTNGIQGDGSYLINAAHTAAHSASPSAANRAWVGNSSIVEPCMLATAATMERRRRSPTTSSKLGWLAGVYAQDEWRVTDQFTINAGLRFDQMWQYVDANQLSPRLSFTYKPFEDTTFHAGYARYFTPPVLVEAAPANIALFNNTTRRAGERRHHPVLPERSHYFDAGVDQKIRFGCIRRRGERLRHPRSRHRRLLQDRKGPDRQRQFRPGAGAERLQLRQRHQ